MAAVTVAAAAVAAAAGLPAANATPGGVPTVTGDVKVDKLLAQMTLDDKLTIIEGQAEALSPDKQYQAGYLPGIPRLGIPSLKLSDGPPGVITKQDSTGMTDTMGVAATFSDADARANGDVIGRDANALGMDVVLEPFVNMNRDTSWGRGFNTFGEDPLLTSNIGASEITGIQSTGTMAMVKHYVAYDGGNNVSVDQQTLHEIYVAPFAAAIKAGVSSIMCSYNALNSTTAASCGNYDTLTTILRDELGFKGFVTSDWGATHATSYINAGQDMEMPGGSCGTGGFIQSYFCSDELKAAIADGQVSEARVTQAAGRILYEYDQFGLLNHAPKHTVTPEDRANDNNVVQQTGEDAAVLLKNDGNALPLHTGSSIALIGPTAGQTDATDGGGEKSGGIVAEQVGTYQVLNQMIGDSTPLSYSVADDMTGTPIPASALSHNGQPGLVRTSGSATSVDSQLWFTTQKGNALPAGSSNTWTGTLTVPASGSYWINFGLLGAVGSVTLDGAMLGGSGPFGGGGVSARYGTLHATDGNGPLPATDGLANTRYQVNLTAGAHTLTVAQTPDVSGAPVQVRLSWVTPQQQQANHDAAVAAAKKASTVVVFAWANSGTDLSQPLADGQDQLISDVAAVNPNTIVVLNTGQPIAMPWLNKVKAVLEMWYPGDRGGYATANVLLGNVNPGGKLPTTWPVSIDQELAHQADHPERSSAGVGQPCAGFSGFLAPWSCPLTTYSEGVDIGYRFFDATNETPLYPFGYGLSYTTFAYSGLHAVRSGHDGLTVSVHVTNTGGVAGDAVPQVYIGAPANQPAGVQFAPRALAGYSRVHLNANQSRTVVITVPERQLQYWSTASSQWVTATGQRTLYLSSDDRTNQLQQNITIN